MYYRTFSLSLTWIGHNATPYHSFNVLPHALPYIFSQFSMVSGYLPRVNVNFIKNIYINIFLKNDGSAWQHVANSPKPGNYQTKYTIKRVIYGNTLHYDLSMFAEFKKLPYPFVISISARFHKVFPLPYWNLLNK